MLIIVDVWIIYWWCEGNMFADYRQDVCQVEKKIYCCFGIVKAELLHHVYSKSSCWNEIREMSIFKSIFWKSSFSVNDPTNAIQCSPLIVLYFENRNWPVVILKRLFPWFFVSVLIFDLGYIIWWSVNKVTLCEFQGKQKAQVKTWGFIKKDFFFSTNLISMHNNK